MARDPDWRPGSKAWNAAADYDAPQTNTVIQAAPGVGRRLVIIALSISNGAVAGKVTLLDGSGGSVLYPLYPAINGGATYSPTRIPLSENTALVITSTDVTTHGVAVDGYSEPTT